MYCSSERLEEQPGTSYESEMDNNPLIVSPIHTRTPSKSNAQLERKRNICSIINNIEESEIENESDVTETDTDMNEEDIPYEDSESGNESLESLAASLT